jgi:hypothetical protein
VSDVSLAGTLGPTVQLGVGGDRRNSSRVPGDRRLIRRSLHKRNFRLDNGDCTNDDDYKVLAFDVKESNHGELLVLLPPEDDLDAMIGSSKCEWRDASVPHCFIAIVAWPTKRTCGVIDPRPWK